MRCDLVLLIDQFEELFAAFGRATAERSAFIDLMAELAGTGRIWVVVTLRADFYARMLDQPALKKLKELGATYDLAPPGPVELAEIVRAPGRSRRALVFETDAASGERLDARLLRDADRPDMLPLVQLALSRLFEGRETVRRRHCAAAEGLRQPRRPQGHRQRGRRAGAGVGGRRRRSAAAAPVAPACGSGS